MRSDIHDIEVQYQHRTERAVCVRPYEGAADVWLPLSDVEIDPAEARRGDTVTLTCPERLLLDKGLI